MGAFNILTAEANCPNCRRVSEFEAQFKYGNTWQQVYSLGQQLKWGGNDIGTPGSRKVIVEAIGGPCPYCQKDDLEFHILLESDRLISIKPASENRGYLFVDGFVIIEP